MSIEWEFWGLMEIDRGAVYFAIHKGEASSSSPNWDTIIDLLSAGF